MKKLLFIFATLTICKAEPLLNITRQYLVVRPAQASNAVTLICDLREGGNHRQWLLTLQESATPLRKGEDSRSWIVEHFQHTLHCSTGRDYSFEEKPFAMDVEMIGPFMDLGVQPVGVSQRAIGNSLYFDEGLFPTAVLYERVQRTGRPIPQLAFLFRAKYSSERIAADQAAVRSAGMTPGDEREIARSAFAMTQFGMIAGRMKAFREILGSVIDPPGIRHGIYINIDWSKLTRSPVTLGNYGITDRYEAPITLQTKNRLTGRIAFVRPVGGLRFCAGLVEMDFDTSEKSPGSSLRIWLYQKTEAQVPMANLVPEPTTVGTFDSVFAVPVTSRRWLGFLR